MSEIANYYTDNSHSWAEQGKKHETNLIPHWLPPQVAQQFLHYVRLYKLCTFNSKWIHSCDCILNIY